MQNWLLLQEYGTHPAVVTKRQWQSSHRAGALQTGFLTKSTGNRDSFPQYHREVKAVTASDDEFFSSIFKTTTERRCLDAIPRPKDCHPVFVSFREKRIEDFSPGSWCFLHSGFVQYSTPWAIPHMGQDWNEMNGPEAWAFAVTLWLSSHLK